MKNPIFLGSMILMMAYLNTAVAAEISSVQLRSDDVESLIEIGGEGLLGYSKVEKKSPPQLVFTFDNAKLAESAKQKLDPSAESNSLLQISSYAISGGKVRVVVDFKKTPKYSVEDTDQKITLHIQGALNQESSNATAKISESKVDPKVADTDALTTIMSAEKEQKFTGSPITLKLKNADVHEVLRLISEASGFNIVIHPSVSGNITVSLENVPWDQALDVVLTTLKLGAERNESVLRVMPRDMLVKEKQDDLDAKKLSTQTAPRITRIFPISYADLGQISSLLQSFANSQNNVPGASGVPATILVDQNTQSLVVRDTADSVERIRKMIQLLDIQTPQVMIEGKVVEATESFNKDLEGNIGVAGPGYAIGFNSAPPTAALAGAATSTSSTSSSGSSTRSSGVNLNIIKTISLNANLTYAEKQSKVKIVSSPKTVVLSGKSSSISQTTSIAVQNSVLGTGGGVNTQLQQVTAKTQLDVTPRVTNDGSVFMKLTLNRDAFNFDNPNRPSTAPRSMQTEVIVESGNTLVIGGVLNLDETNSEQGFPILRKIPVIGWLFGSEVSNRTKTELMFFVTPRILNQKKTAMGIMNDTEAPKAQTAL